MPATCCSAGWRSCAPRRAGLLALMNISRVDPAALTADSIGFQLGPRMNALGRLEDATVSVELLTTRDAIRAGQLAARLERLNQERRLLTSQTTRAANEMIERDPSLLNYNALVLAHPNWHAGVVGIVASKLVEQYGKPAVLLLNPPGEPARGSARSVPGVDIGASIAACSRLLLSHGGHPGAAGVSLLPENIDAFRRELSRQVTVHRDETVESGLQIDAEVRLDELSLLLAEDLARLAPFGSGQPTPQFVTYGLHIADDRRIGREGTHRKLTVRGDAATDSAGESLPVVWFGGADAELPAGPIDLLYTLNVNEYKGERSLQLMYVDSRPAQPAQAARHAAPTAARGGSAQGRECTSTCNRCIRRRRRCPPPKRRSPGTPRACAWMPLPPGVAMPRACSLRRRWRRQDGSRRRWCCGAFRPRPTCCAGCWTPCARPEVYLCGALHGRRRHERRAARRGRHVQICAQPSAAGRTASSDAARHQPHGRAAGDHGGRSAPGPACGWRRAATST